jgi:hypothetical protein
MQPVHELTQCPNEDGVGMSELTIIFAVVGDSPVLNVAGL